MVYPVSFTEWFNSGYDEKGRPAGYKPIHYYSKSFVLAVYSLR